MAGPDCGQAPEAVEIWSGSMSHLPYLLPALGCPVAMGLMMWLVMRRPARSVSPAPDASELAELREELAQLREQGQSNPATAPSP
jgi:hypothetical protein